MEVLLHLAGLALLEPFRRGRIPFESRSRAFLGSGKADGRVAVVRVQDGGVNSASKVGKGCPLNEYFHPLAS